MRDMLAVHVRSAKGTHALNGHSSVGGVTSLMRSFVGAVATRRPADGVAIVIRVPVVGVDMANGPCWSPATIHNTVTHARLPHG